MTKSVTDTPTVEQQRILVERILASALFRKSHKLAAFLKFICEQQQLGKSDTINEQRIGTVVFGRSEGYHMGEDSIVRSQARFLRLRLQEYFAAEGRDEPIILTIPKGSYVPEFHYRELTAELQPPKTATSASEPHEGSATQKVIEKEQTAFSRDRLLLPVLVAAICVVSFLVWHFRPRKMARIPVESRFWASIFDPHRTEIIVPADSSLILMEELSGTPVDPADYMSRKYLQMPPPAGMAQAWRALAESQYTNVADLNLVSRLGRIPAFAAGNVKIRFARKLTLTELKEANAILIGSSRANPWVTLFDSYGRFNAGYDWHSHVNFVSNRSPGAGEQARYEEVGDGPEHVAYGVISYLPSLDGEGSTLLVGGTSKAGTEAAAEFLFSSRFAIFLQEMDSGGPVPHFEILLSTENLNGDSYYGKVIAFHRLPDAPSNR